MCGRTACTLAPDVICNACSYFDPKIHTFRQPIWREHPSSTVTSNSYKYYASANQTPSRFTPVMIKGNKMDDDTGSRILQPMMWGLIPPWHKHRVAVPIGCKVLINEVNTDNPQKLTKMDFIEPKGEANSHGLSTNNARIEGLPDSKLYKRPLSQRNLCVIIAQGFYEWKTVGTTSPKATKQPYFIYMPQVDETVKIYDDSIWRSSTWDEGKGWDGPSILMMAGLYDIWKSPKGDAVYSYTVITMESNSTLSWLHHRMPAILDTPEQVETWLTASPDTPTDELLKILKPSEKLQHYAVSTKVNNSRCRDLDCMNPLTERENKSKSFMTNWLQKSERTKTIIKDEGVEMKKQEVEEPVSKKPKLEKSEELRK